MSEVSSKLRYFRSKRGFLKTNYNNQVKNSKSRKHSLPDYSSEEFVEWALSKDSFHKLFENWELSNYDKWKVPSFDRLDSSKGYSFKNIEIVTWRENHDRNIADKLSGKNAPMGKAVVKLDPETLEELEDYPTLILATKALGKTKNAVSGMSQAIKKDREIYGFRWKFKK